MELYDGYDSERTDPSFAWVRLLTGPGRLRGPFFVCYSAVHWADHLRDTASYDDMNLDVHQSVLQFLAKFEARYDSTKVVEPDLLRWISFARAAVKAGGIHKHFSAPFSLSLLNGLRTRYMLERNISNASDWYRFALTAEIDYAGLSVDPITYVRHLEQAAIEFNAQAGCQGDLEALISLYERWERQYPHLVTARYSLAFRDWLRRDQQTEDQDQQTEDLTGYFSVGVEGEGMLETSLHVRYPGPLMVRMQSCVKSSKSSEGRSLLGWIVFLQKSNPRLNQTINSLLVSIPT